MQASVRQPDAARHPLPAAVNRAWPLPGAATTFSVVEYDRGEARPAEPLRERGEAASFDGADAVGVVRSRHRRTLLPVQVAVSRRGSEESHVVLGGGDDVIHLSVQGLPGHAEGEASG